MATVFSCVGSSRVGDPPWMENSGWFAAIVPPFDATLCSGFAPRGQGPPGRNAAMMSLIGPSGECCCDAGAHGRLGPLRAKPLLSVFVDAPVSCDAGCCGGRAPWFLCDD